MKSYRPVIWIVALALTGIAMTDCQSDVLDPEIEISVSADPSENDVLYACVVEPTESRSLASGQNILFTEEDVEWFNAMTREIKFRDMERPLYQRLMGVHEIEFHLGENVLFVVSSFVGLWNSQVFTDLVLCYGNQETYEIDGKYYLYDCYPFQFSDLDEVKANAEAKSGQWKAFISYMESLGKLR